MKKSRQIIVVLLLLGTVLSAQSKLGLGVNGGYLSSTGDLKDLFKDGFGGVASVTYNLTNSFQLSATTGYFGFSFNNDYINDLLREAGYDKTVNLDATLNLIPIMIGAKYFVGNSQLRPYGCVDLGLHIMSVTVPNAQITSSGVSTNESTETKAGYAIGVGFLYQLSDKISLDVNAKFNGNGLEVNKSSVKTQGGAVVEESSSSTSTFFSIMAGVWFQL
jgi:outer membrane protein W